MVGNIITFLAVPWFVLQTTGSAARTGLTGGVVVLGMVLGGFFGGPLVDRIGFRRASIVADLAAPKNLSFAGVEQTGCDPHPGVTKRRLLNW
jgi:MFS family permease